MKICAYVQESYAKSAYKNECMDRRQFAGLHVIIDSLKRAGINVDYAGISNVNKYDIILVSLTSDCDWWSFIKERMQWQKGEYKVLIGGAGVLHVAPFLQWFDVAIFGRGENLIVPLVSEIERGNRFHDDSIMWSDEFDINRVWRIAQVDKPYSNIVKLSNGKVFAEGAIGCNHHCLFCGYTWHRKFASPYKHYKMEDSLFGNIADKERAMLDLNDDSYSVDFSKLRTTAIDGFSERLRIGVGKPITRDIIERFLTAMVNSGQKPHKLKLYNICGFPTETENDWHEFINTVKEVDARFNSDEKQWMMDLHSTPFRAMPATPMACAPMQKRNFRNVFAKTIANSQNGLILYRGKRISVVDSFAIDSLATVMLSAIAHRGSVEDSENIAKLCCTKKFWSASSLVKENTLSKYFDMDKLFDAFTPEQLPSKYLRTYLPIERSWGKTPLEKEFLKMARHRK